MRNIVEEIKDTYNKIKVTEKLEERVLNNTVYKKKENNIIGKMVATLGILVGIGTISISIVYADDIRDYLKKWQAEYSFINQENTILGKEYTYKNIEKDLYNTYGKSEILNYKTVEDNLGFKILKSKLQTSEEIIYTTFVNKDNKTIASVNLWMPDFIKNDTFDISLDASFITENADIEYKAGTLEDATGAIKKYVGKEKSNFGSDILFYTISRLKDNADFTTENYETIDLLSASFIYEGIKYNMSSNKEITQENMLIIINSLNY